jgi:dihydrofolate reductase
MPQRKTAPSHSTPPSSTSLSRSHPRLDWSNSVLIEGVAAEGIAALKKEDRSELQVHGSGNLTQTLLRHNLVDQYRLWVFPLVIGSRGKRLLSEGTIPSGLKFVDSKVSTTGSRNRYLRAGKRDRHRIVRTGLRLGPGGTLVSGPERGWSGRSIASWGASGRTSRRASPISRAADWCAHRPERLAAIPAFAGRASP